MTSDGTRTFEWDVENRLTAVVIVATGHRSEFEYDGLGRRVQIVEKDPDATQTLQTTSDKKYLWVGTTIAEERTGDDGGTVTKRFYAQGFVDNDGTILLYTRDHLGSIRELVDMSQTVRARYDYDPFGRVTKVSGDRDSVFLYTGHFWHAQSGLYLTLYRAYDANLGRWLSRDPIGESGGMNFYAYVGNNPINAFDPLGLFCWGAFWDGFNKNLIWNIGIGIAAALLIAICPPAAVPLLLALGLSALTLTAINLAVDALDPGVSPEAFASELGGLTSALVGGALGGAAGSAGINAAMASAAGEAGASGEGFVNLASEARTSHILYGDSPNSGGHMAPGNPGKSIFPSDWSGPKIMHAISDVATNPNYQWTPQTGNGGLFTNAGNPARFSVVGSYEGVTIKVVVEPAGEGIVTGFPVHP